MRTAKSFSASPIATSFKFWIGAIITALIELSAKLSGEPGSFLTTVAASRGELGVRFTAYAVLLTLSLVMVSGRAWARWPLLVIFGGVGTFSLVFEPISWMWEGGSASAFLASANMGTWVTIASRVAHIICVWAAIVFMFLTRESRSFHNFPR
jgi:hypothetical protein